MNSLSRCLASIRYQVFFISVGLIFGLYALTASPAITLNDAGDLILAAQTLGVAHSPGYPLFTLLGYGFSKVLWFLDPAHQINIMTALFGAVGCSLLAVIAFEITTNKVLSILAALMLAFSSMTWYLSVTTEVYTLNLVFTAALWLLSLQNHRAFSVRRFYGFCFLVGLGLSNSYPLLILSSVGLVFLVPFKHLTVKRMALGSLLLAAGLLPYVYFFIQSQRLSELRYVFIDISTPDKIIEYILRKPYVVADQKASFLAEKIRVLGAMVLFFGKEFMLFSPVVVFGIYHAFKNRSNLRWPLVISLIASSLVLAMMLGITPDRGAVLQFAEYLLPALAFLTLFGIMGLQALLVSFPKFGTQGMALVYLFGLGSQIVHANGKANQWNNHQVENWGLTLLNSLPPQSNLVFCGDEALPLEFLQTVKGIRPDIVPYSSYWGGTRSYLYITGPDVVKSIESDLTIEGLLASSNAATYITNCPRVYMEQGYTLKLKGLTYQILSEKVPEQKGLELTPETLRSTLDSILLGPAQENHWMSLLRLSSAKMILAHGVQLGIIEDLGPHLKHYALDQNKSFLAALASELAFASRFDIAMNLYHAVGFENMDEVDSGDAAVLCRLLLIQNDISQAQKICLIPEQKSRVCNADSKYNLGRAFWIDKAKSLEYLKSAKACNPNAAVIIQALEEREALP